MPGPTCFFGCDCQHVTGLAHANTVDGKHTKDVGFGWTQIHQSHLSQRRIWDLSSYCGIPGCCATANRWDHILQSLFESMQSRKLYLVFTLFVFEINTEGCERPATIKPRGPAYCDSSFPHLSHLDLQGTRARYKAWKAKYNAVQKNY